MKFTNVELWNALRAKYKSFASITAEATADTFTEKGWGEISRNNIPALNQFFELSMRVAFNKMDIARVNTRLEESGLVEVYGGNNGGYLQRISVESIAPISPGFINLTNGDSIDPFIVRKPESKERFFECGNFNYQSLITIQEYQVKTIFLAESGMSAFLAGIMIGLENGYKQQKELNCYKALHECINSTEKPLQDTQKLTVTSWTDGAVTENELLDFITQLQDLATAMDTAITQPGFNANKFDTAVRPEDNVVLVRAGIMNQIKRMKALNTHYEGASNMLDIPFTIIEVADFGGIQHYIMNDGTKQVLYPHYDAKLGNVDGWATSEGGEKVYNLNDKNILVEDLDANVLAVVAQKGLIFEDIKEPYQVQPIYNPRGMYNNYWANAANNMIRYDANYTCVTISKPTV